MKKFWTISSLALIGVLILLTIILAVTSYSFKPMIKNPDRFEIYRGSSSSTTYRRAGGDANETEKYKDILGLFNDSFRESVITAIFKGDIGGKPKVTTESPINYTSIDSGTYMMLHYDSEQTLKTGNKDFAINNKVITYTRLLCQIVVEDNGFAQVKIRVVDDSYTSTSFKSKYSYTISADYTGLNDYIKELIIV